MASSPCTCDDQEAYQANVPPRDTYWFVLPRVIASPARWHAIPYSAADHEILMGMAMKRLEDLVLQVCQQGLA